MNGIVVAVCQSADHAFSKTPQTQITLRAGLGVEGEQFQSGLLAAVLARDAQAT